MIEIVQQTGLFPDLLRFGLNSMLDVKRYSGVLPKLIRIRKKLQRRQQLKLADYVEFFDKNKYLYFSSLAKNLNSVPETRAPFMKKTFLKTSISWIFWKHPS